MAARKQTQVTASLRAAVLRSLDRLDAVAAGASSPTQARAELSRLTDGWRLLLQVHRSDENSRCVACPHRLRGKRWPCQVWRLAHRHLIGDGQRRGERHRPGFRRTMAQDLPGELTMELPIIAADGPRPVHRSE
jgi:hypothetical protein